MFICLKTFTASLANKFSNFLFMLKCFLEKVLPIFQMTRSLLSRKFDHIFRRVMIVAIHRWPRIHRGNFLQFPISFSLNRWIYHFLFCFELVFFRAYSFGASHIIQQQQQKQPRHSARKHTHAEYSHLAPDSQYDAIVCGFFCKIKLLFDWEVSEIR